MKRKINIRPTTGVYSTYKRLSYQPWTAIAEFVDNSTQSFYDHSNELHQLKYYKKLTITIEYTEDAINGDSLVIRDNAYGMEWDDFQRAVILDKPPKNITGRNEFGMGLKTAACWFGNWWSVESSQLNSTRKFYAEMDIDILEKYKNEEIEVIEEAENPKTHYTVITIKKLNKKIKGSRTKAKVKDLLSSLYRVDLRSEQIEIIVSYNGNENILEYETPTAYEEKLADGTIKKWYQPINFALESEGETFHVNGFIALRLPGSLANAGLTLLRRGRVIIGGPDCNYRPKEIFGDPNSYSYQRLFGELHMDDWKVTQAKDDFDWHNSGLEEAFINKLLEFTKDYRIKAESIRTREKVVTNNVLKKVEEDLSVPGLIDDLRIEVIDTPSVVSTSNEETSNYDTEQDIPPVDVEGSTSAKMSFKYKNAENYIFFINYELNSPLSSWLSVSNVNSYQYELKINMRHPYFEPLIHNKDFMHPMTKFIIAMVLAEIESMKMSSDGRISPHDIRVGMNSILEAVIKNGVEK